jgi:hypothetical protein
LRLRGTAGNDARAWASQEAKLTFGEGNSVVRSVQECPRRASGLEHAHDWYGRNIFCVVGHRVSAQINRQP